MLEHKDGSRGKDYSLGVMRCVLLVPANIWCTVVTSSGNYRLTPANIWCTVVTSSGNYRLTNSCLLHVIRRLSISAGGHILLIIKL